MRKKSLLIAIIVLILDIVTKNIIDSNFLLLESKTIINNFFSITKVYNYGASWSILTGQATFLIIIAIIILLVLFFYQSKFLKNKKNIFAFSLLYGGITGNLIDRIAYGYVIDYLDFKIFNYDFPVFNIADICIVIGILLLIIAIYKKEDLYEVSSK